MIALSRAPSRREVPLSRQFTSCRGPSQLTEHLPAHPPYVGSDGRGGAAVMGVSYG
jgi:hypothetical protein